MLNQNHSILLRMKTAGGTKLRINMVTWSFLPFAVNVILDLSVLKVDLSLIYMWTAKMDKAGAFP